jgi:hypothetical protein
MIHPYKYINHDIEKLQKYLDYLFIEVWCKARGAFDSTKLNGNAELKTIYETLHHDDGKWATFFNGHIEKIYAEYLKISKSGRKKLKKYYLINNNINALCLSNRKTPVCYDDLKKEFPKLTALLNTFYSNLYGSTSPFILATFGNLNTLKADHYKKFVIANFGGHEGKCPFCGLNPIKGNDHTKLEAYDHFLPKGIYPFNSINFANLSPMCHECNSSYKLEKEPLLNIDPVKKKNKTRRKAFYPYSKEKWNLSFKVEFTNSDFGTLKKEEINIDVAANNRNEEIESWLEVYGIQERYRAKILAKHDGQRWLSDITDGVLNARVKLKNPLLTKEEWYELKLSECEADLLADCNFLKKAFIEECKNVGIV